MKVILAIMISCAALFISNVTLADGCGSNDSCGMSSCSEDESECNCTDPLCKQTWHSSCMDTGSCCRDFGNVGGLR